MPHTHKTHTEIADQKTPLVCVKMVSYEYNKGLPVLTDIDFDIMQGDFIGMVGPNGGGKSTLLKLMMGILPLQKGAITLFGTDVKKFKQRNLIGYVSQKATHFDQRFPATVGEIVAMGRVQTRGLFHPLTKEDYEISRSALKDVGMLKYESTPLHELSGGQQQRVFIARALASNPKLLVLDEPTIGIDIKAQEQFYDLLQQLRKEKGLTIVLVSHDIDVIASQANVFACINQTLIYHGHPEYFVKNDYLKKLYGKNIRMVLHGH